MATLLADNAYGTLASGLAAGDTTLTWTAGHGARFPAVTGSDVLYVTILNSSNVLEEVIITAHTSGADTATITRAAGSTTAKAWVAGDRVEARVSNTALSTMVAQIPQNSQSAAYTTVLSDANKHILHPAADTNNRTFTIDSNANVAYPVGTAITFINEINTVTIAITADTLMWAGPGTTGSRTLAAYGWATALKITTTKWMISGVGLS